MNSFTYVFLVALALSLATQLWLAGRQLRHLQRNRDTVPGPFDAKVSLENHRKAADYTIAKMRLELFETALGGLLLLVWTLGGGLDLLDRSWRALALPELATGVGYLLSFVLIAAALDLPLAAYRIFSIEQRFGFNRTTPGLFITDTLKQGLLIAVIGAPLAAVVLWLMRNAGAYWWLYVWAVWMGFSLVMMWAYPAVIAPLFNKFSPLKNEALRNRIQELLTRCGFTSRGVFVVDGSRRSGHGNAYFTGLGTNKRIVFFDTLLNTLNDDEIEAVLAHELGHFSRRHITKRMTLMAALSLAGLAILGWLIAEPWFYHGLGVGTVSLHVALALFLLVAPVFTFFLQPVLAYTSRRHEFEADEFAAEHSNGQRLIEALVKLYEENASPLTRDRLYSAFHDSHPPAPTRIAHLSAKMAG